MPPLLLLIAACGTSLPPGAPSLVGHYVRTRLTARDNPAWSGIVGDWRSEYRRDGHLIVHGPNGQVVDSLWRLDGDLLTLSDTNDTAGIMSCRLSGIDTASGSYRIRFVGDELHFQPLRDECDGRRSVVENHPLRKVQ